MIVWSLTPAGNEKRHILSRCLYGCSHVEKLSANAATAKQHQEHLSATCLDHTLPSVAALIKRGARPAIFGIIVFGSVALFIGSRGAYALFRDFKVSSVLCEPYSFLAVDLESFL